MNITLSPAYGREYKSAAAAKADFEAGKDFIIEDVMNRWCGKPASKADLKGAGYTTVELRFDGLRKVAVVNL